MGKGFSYVETKQESVQPAQLHHKIILKAKDNHLNPAYSPCFQTQNAPAIERGDQHTEFFGKTHINATGTAGYIPLPGLIVEKDLATQRQRRNQYNRHSHHKIQRNQSIELQQT